VRQSTVAITVDFFRFDAVKITSALDAYTIYGENIHLRRGNCGSVLEPGTAPNSYIVEFKIGRGEDSSDFTAVEVDGANLILERRKQRRLIYF
jgi:hypothetical protein